MEAKIGLSNATSSPTMWKHRWKDLCASSGEEMVSRAAASRFSTYTIFCFSTAPTITARPFGSTARNCPGTMRRQPLLPNVSWWTCWKAPRSSLYSRITRRPLSLPTTT